MPNKAHKVFLFDTPAIEITKSLYKVVSNELNEQKAHNLPIVYKNEMCVDKNQFIHEYSDGRKFLISQNRNNSEEKIIRQL